jgi:hypothetical protein
MKATNTKAATLIATLKAVGAADGKRDDKLKLAAGAIIVAYPTRDAWDAMPKETLRRLRAAYASGRLSSAEFKLWNTPVKGLTDAAKAERLALHRDINTAWGRVIGHAYPKAKTVSAEGGKAEGDKTEEEKTEGAASPDKWAKVLSTMLTQAQKAEGLKNIDLV